MPSQDVNDSPTDASAGNHTKAISSSVGMPHITVSTSLSVRVSRLTRPLRFGAARSVVTFVTTVTR